MLKFIFTSTYLPNNQGAKIRKITYRTRDSVEIDLKYSLNHMHTTQAQYLLAMLDACNKAQFSNWNTIKPHAENEFNSLLQILLWLAKKRQNDEITTEQARIHVDIQKNTMRTRLMTLHSVSMVEAEHIINTAIDSIRTDFYTEMDWVII